MIWKTIFWKESLHYSGSLLSSNKYSSTNLTPWGIPWEIKRGSMIYRNTSGACWDWNIYTESMTASQKKKNIQMQDWSLKTKVRLEPLNACANTRNQLVKVLTLGVKWTSSLWENWVRHNWWNVSYSAQGQRGGFGNLFKSFPIYTYNSITWKAASILNSLARVHY